MKISEITNMLVEDQFVVEMANFIADVTDLPANIVLWCKTQPEELPHTKYRMKVFKDRIHVATLSIEKSPKILWETTKKKSQLDSYELSEANSVIEQFTSLFIQYIDGTMNSDDVKIQIKKIKNS
jgi:hypothetical protein